MAMEIERKYLLSSTAQLNGLTGKEIRQGYIDVKDETTVRVRIKADKAFLTIKSKSSGSSRLEFEYEIPTGDAQQMIETLCRKPVIEKTRYKIDYAGKTWEVDVFYGDNKGLVLAEIELESEDEEFEIPSWIDKEVTEDKRYFNAYLSQNPYTKW